MIQSIFVLNGSKIENITSAQLQEYSGKGFVWVDVEDSVDEDFEYLKNILPLHDLACDIVTRKYSRSKITEFDKHLFMIVHEPFEEGKKVSFLSTAFFIGDKFLVTAHKESLVSIDSVKRNIELNPSVFKRGPAYLVYLIIDGVIDEYFPILDSLDRNLNEVERLVFDNKSKATLTMIFNLRREVLDLRKKVIPAREVLGTLSRFESNYIPHKYSIYYRDLYDHLIRISEMIDAYRDLLTGILDVHISIQSQRLNEVMKVLTVIATIMMPLTLITGFYGMNIIFPDVALLGDNTYWFILIMMSAVVIIMLYYFKNKKWM